MSSEVLKTELVKVGQDSLQAVRKSGHGWVLLKAACEALGLDQSAQRKKLQEAPWATGAMIASVGADGRTREMFCLRSDKVAMWLATIDTSRLANDEARARLVMWQCEAAEVLDQWLRGAEHVSPAALPAQWEQLAAKVEALSQLVHRSGAEQPRKGIVWLIDRTLRDLEARGLYRWPDKSHITGPETELVIKHRQPVSADEVPTGELVWFACGCHSKHLDAADKAILGILSSMQGMIGMQALAVMLDLDARSVRYPITRLLANGYLTIHDYGPGKPKDYVVNRELVCGHRPECGSGDEGEAGSLAASELLQ